MVLEKKQVLLFKKISNYFKLKHYKIITKNEPSFGINVDIKLMNNIF